MGGAVVKKGGSMKVLNVTKFFGSDIHLTLIFEAEGFKCIAQIDSGYGFKGTDFNQTLRITLEQLQTNGDYDLTLFGEFLDRTFNRASDIHAALREFISSMSFELLMEGFALAGSYEYDGKTWEINPPQIIEKFDLPDGFLTSSETVT